MWRQRFGASSVVRLSFLKKDIYVVSGAELLNAIWKNTRGMTSTNGINIALSNMFNTPKEDMLFFEADDSGITHDPHPRSATKIENRVFYLMHKATVDCLAGSHLTAAALAFQTALAERDFWMFNGTMPRLLQGWPRWMMPKAWQARDRCIAAMKKWRSMTDGFAFDGNAMIPRRWSYFSRMKELSEHGVACSDLGILWGMNSNSMPATFWLFWHIVQDRRLLDRVQAEVDHCQASCTGSTSTFDTTALCNQPLLQSIYAETLRKYTAVYIIRKPEHEDAQIMNYRVPKDKMIVVSSASAHMDKRNWNVGSLGEHPVDQFWADRFLTYTCKSTQPSAAKTTATTSMTPPSTVASAPVSALHEKHSQDVRFSLNGYGGAWIPFGGGIHQCPGRHWVKLQMLFSFAMINQAFEIELLDTKDRLRVDMRKFGLGALQPAEKARFRIRRKYHVVPVGSEGK
ncbi:MAG: hypothetical protein Q9223_006229 [Gallowayella weberi]